VLQLPITANVVSRSLNLFTLILEATGFSESSVLTTAIRRHITEDGILYSHKIHGKVNILSQQQRYDNVDRSLNSLALSPQAKYAD
jgi:hypothetical protein